MKNFRLIGWVVITMLFAGTAYAANNEYPYRALYPGVPLLTTTQLYQRNGTVVVMDARSKYEYDTLHIKDSGNISLDDPKFLDKVRNLRQSTSKPIVFYCNGKTCHKSYEAVRRSMEAGIANCYAYDPGIFEWARTYPDRTVLLGNSPIKVEDLIDDAKFKAHILSVKDFIAHTGPSAIILDVRDPAQRDIALFPLKEERAPLDKKDLISAVIERAKRENKTLLIFDKVGKQVQWFQYELESKGVKNYYFLKDGEDGYFEATLGK